MEELLITLVRNYPAIYDRKHPQYKDRAGVVMNIWRTINRELMNAGYQEFSDNLPLLQKKWHNLRDSYYQAKKRQKKKAASGPGAVKEPTWHLWNEMTWIDDHMTVNVSATQRTAQTMSLVQTSASGDGQTSATDDGFLVDNSDWCVAANGLEQKAETKHGHYKLEDNETDQHEQEMDEWQYYYYSESTSQNLQSKAADMMRLIYRITETFTSNPQLLIQPVHTTTPSTHTTTVKSKHLIQPVHTTTPSTHTTTVKSKHHDLLAAIKHMANIASSLGVTLETKIKVESDLCRWSSEDKNNQDLRHQESQNRKIPKTAVVNPNKTQNAKVPTRNYKISYDTERCLFDLVDICHSKESKPSSPKCLQNNKSSEQSCNNVDIPDVARSTELKESDYGEKNLSVEPPNMHDNKTLQRGTEANPSFSDNVLSVEPKLTNNIEDPFFYDTTADTSFAPNEIREKRPYVRKTPVVKKARKLYTCDHCSYTTGHRGTMTTHGITHSTEKPYTCDFPDCDFKTSWEINVKKHRIIHKGEKHHLCDICGKRFLRAYSLIIHRQIHGIGAKELKCPHCDFTTIWTEHIKRHLRIHTGEKPYKCTECSYASNQRYNLVGHMRTHTGEKPFKCDHCDYAAAHRATLTSHIKYKHEKK